MNRMERFIPYFFAHRNVTKALVNKIELENYDYQPTPTSMSAKDLVIHMITSFYKFAAVVKEGTPAPFLAKTEDAETDLVALEEKYTAKTKEILETLTQEDLDRVVELKKIFGMDMSGGQILQLAMDHEIHHKGNLFVYVREMGHTDLPMFITK